MGYAFISYSRSDRDYVAKLAKHLAEHAVATWYDYDLVSGDSFPQLIQDKIDECSVLVPVLTPEAVSSDWVLIEINYAHQNRKPVMPLLLAPGGKKPIVLTLLQVEDVTGGGLPSAQFVGRLRDLCGGLISTGHLQSSTDSEQEIPPSSYEIAGTLAGHRGPVGGVAYSPDGRHIVTGATDRTVRIWDAATFRAVKVLRDPLGPGWPVAFSPDGTRILTGATDEYTTLLWDARSATVLRQVSTHTDWVYGVAFTPDGRFHRDRQRRSDGCCVGVGVWRTGPQDCGTRPAVLAAAFLAGRPGAGGRQRGRPDRRRLRHRDGCGAVHPGRAHRLRRGPRLLA